MFQSFEEISSPAAVPERVTALRRELKSRKLKGFLVPHSDEHQDEFLPPSAERLRWLTGFTGSAGAAIVLENAAVLFVDGRYPLQARAQTDTSVFEVLQTPEAKASKWLAGQLPKGGTIGYDPNLHTIKEIERLTESLGKAGITLAPQETNPIDQLWQDRPAPPSAPVIPHGLELAGRSAKEKIAELQETLKREKADAVLLTLLDSIAWLFNIRGGDISHSPLALAFALVPARGKPSLFIDPAKIGGNVRGHLKEAAELLAPDDLAGRLAALGHEGGARAPRSGHDAGALRANSPSCRRQDRGGRRSLHSAKGDQEQRRDRGRASRAYSRRRGHGALSRLARCSFCLWPRRRDRRGDEARGVQARHGRAQGSELRLDLGGRTARCGGALPANDREQYQAQATLALSHRLWRSICRRHHRRDAHHRHRHAERHDAAALHAGAQGPYRHRRARFPKGTRGQDIDPFARRPLWEAGLDFDHGTGHGVGSYLSVHEPPQRISRHGTVELQPGMILSNEPGLYREGEYGIRLENLVLVTPPSPIKGGTREMLGFETLTLVPFDRRLIDPALLTRDELAWLNAYHAEVRRKIAPLLKGADRSWLREATARIG